MLDPEPPSNLQDAAGQISWSPSLREAARAFADSHLVFSGQAMWIGIWGLCELIFADSENLAKANELLSLLMLRSAATMPVVLDSFKLVREGFINPLRELVQSHRAIPIKKYPRYRWGWKYPPQEKFAVIPDMYHQMASYATNLRETNFRIKLVKISSDLEIAIKEYDQLLEQLTVRYRCSESSKCQQDWHSLNQVLIKIDELRRQMIWLDHEGRTGIGVNPNFPANVLIPLLPVWRRWFTKNSVILPFHDLFAKEFSTIAQQIVDCPKNGMIDLTYASLDLAEGYQRLFQSVGLKSIRLVDYDFKSAPKWKEDRQPAIDAVVEAIVTLLPMLSSVQTPPVAVKKEKSHAENIEKGHKIEEQSARESKKFTVIINSFTHVLVDGTQISAKKPRMALLGLAILSQGQPLGSLSFSTSHLLDLIHETPPSTNPSQIWNQYKSELIDKIPNMYFEGDSGQYTILGLDFKFKTGIGLEDIRKLLEKNKAGRKPKQRLQPSH